MNIFSFSTLSIIFVASISLSQECDTLRFDSDGSQVIGYFYSVNLPGSPTLIFTQGFMGTGDIWGIGKTLSSQGINVFMFDFRGCFESEGKQGLMHSQADIGAALSFIRSGGISTKYKIDPTKIILGGYSFGGHMSMLYAIHHPGINRVISISGGDLGILAEQARTHPDIRNDYTGFFQSIRRPKGPVDFKYDDPMKELLDNQAFFSICDQSERLSGTDILMTGGLDDQVVSMEEYLLPLYRKLKKNKGQNLQFIVYQTNHSYKNVSDELLKDMSNWIKMNKHSNP